MPADLLFCLGGSTQVFVQLTIKEEVVTVAGVEEQEMKEEMEEDDESVPAEAIPTGCLCLPKMSLRLPSSLRKMGTSSPCSKIRLAISKQLSRGKGASLPCLIQ